MAGLRRNIPDANPSVLAMRIETPMLALSDSVRRMHGQAFELWKFGPLECPYCIVASGKRWRLRDYGGASSGPPLLIVAAPIKRPYIWDIASSVSVVRFCLQHRFRVYLLEWITPSYEDKDAGLADYAVRSIGQAVTGVSAAAGGARPFLIGHSLGGTFAAIFAAFDPSGLRGLVILSAPLSFAAGSSSFRDSLVAITQLPLPALDIVPGSLLSQLSASAAPETFLWSRPRNAVLQPEQSIGAGDDPPPVWWTPMLGFRARRTVSDECDAPDISRRVQARGG